MKNRKICCLFPKGNENACKTHLAEKNSLIKYDVFAAWYMKHSMSCIVNSLLAQYILAQVAMPHFVVLSYFYYSMIRDAQRTAIKNWEYRCQCYSAPSGITRNVRGEIIIDNPTLVTYIVQPGCYAVLVQAPRQAVPYFENEFKIRRNDMGDVHELFARLGARKMKARHNL